LVQKFLLAVEPGNVTEFLAVRAFSRGKAFSYRLSRYDSGVLRDRYRDLRRLLDPGAPADRGNAFLKFCLLNERTQFDSWNLVGRGDLLFTAIALNAVPQAEIDKIGAVPIRWFRVIAGRCPTLPTPPGIASVAEMQEVCMAFATGAEMMNLRDNGRMENRIIQAVLGMHFAEIQNVEETVKYVSTRPMVPPLTDFCSERIVSVTFAIESRNAVFASLRCLLNSGRCMEYILTSRMAGPPALAIVMHLIGKILARDSDCRSMSLGLAPVMCWPIGDDLTLARTELRPLLEKNACRELEAFVTAHEIPERERRVYDFGCAQEYLHWGAIMVARFAALSMVPFVLHVGPPLPFDLLIDVANPRISTLQVGVSSNEHRFAWCNSLKPFLPECLVDHVFGNACVRAWRCFLSNPEDIILCLRTFRDDLNPELNPMTAVHQTEEFQDPQTFLKLLAAASDELNPSNIFFWA
jgi:hypothetical protein